jgi:hypothetical protein
VGLAKATNDSVKDRHVADQNAFAEVVRQITAEVSSDFSVEKMEVQGDKVETILERTSSGTMVRSALTVNGLKIVERFYDKEAKIFYSLGVLDRVLATDPYRQKMDRSKTDYRTFLKSAKEYNQQGHVFQSILSLRDAYHAASYYQEVLPSFQLLSGPMEFEVETMDDSAEPSTTFVLERLSSTFAGLHLGIEKGDQQSYIPNKPLSDPLAVRLVSRAVDTVPAEGFTIEFRFRSGQGDIFPMTTKTDSHGWASSSVSKIEPSTDKDYTVTATIDFQELLDTSSYRGSWNDRIPVNPVSVLFTLKHKKAPQSMEVWVLISDNSVSHGNPLLVRNVLTSRLTELGFKPIVRGEASDPGRELSWDSLREKAPKNVSVVIFGEITDSSISRAMGIAVCNVNGVVKALDVKSGRMLSVKSFEGIRGFGSTDTQARDDAYKNIGSKMAADLTEDLLGLY